MTVCSTWNHFSWGTDGLIIRFPLSRVLRTHLTKFTSVQDDVDEITVTISTGTDDVDEFYKCTAGALQWHASIKYPVDTAASLDTTPAVMAAQANDYVSYSQSEFKELLTGYINDEVEIRPAEWIGPARKNARRKDDYVSRD